MDFQPFFNDSRGIAQIFIAFHTLGSCEFSWIFTRFHGFLWICKPWIFAGFDRFLGFQDSQSLRLSPECPTRHHRAGSHRGISNMKTYPMEIHETQRKIKTCEKHEKPMKITEKPWKAMKIHEDLWKYVKTTEIHGKHKNQAMHGHPWNLWKSMKINENQTNPWTLGRVAGIPEIPRWTLMVDWDTGLLC